jgi:hypothetical protein
VHVLPIALIGIVLEEEMVLAVLPDEAVRIVVPSAAGTEVQLRPLRLAVEAVLSGKSVGLMDPGDANRMVSVRPRRAETLRKTQ